MRWKLLIAYDGAPFAGWQSQTGGTGVQDHFEAALLTITGERLPLHGSGRTDAGVHALGQVAHFDAPPDSRMTAENWRRALNAALPPAIRVLRATRVPATFNARFAARGKIYRYQLWRGPVLPPHLHQRAWHLPLGLDPATLRRALAPFVGEHDFHAFTANRGTPPTTTIRRITRIHVTTRGPALTVTFEGGGFLYKMVRMLVGAGVRVAQGKESPAHVAALLAHPGQGRWNHVAPADGLTLVRVRY